MQNKKQSPDYRHPDFQALEEKIQYRFHDASLLIEAMTHSSWTNEHRTSHNERLEFLGDAVLELNVSAELYERFPDTREGSLTAMRSSLVGEGSLAEIARNLDLGSCLLMSRGEEKQGGRNRNALIADAVEALIGAVFLDGGHLAAKCLIQRLFINKWPSQADSSQKKDFKTRLQEMTQAELHSLPSYQLIQTCGPEHAREFEVLVELSDGRSFRAKGNSLKIAEQNAAKKAIFSFGSAD